jgi:S1-C subfamily serine protease
MRQTIAPFPFPTNYETATLAQMLPGSCVGRISALAVFCFLASADILRAQGGCLSDCGQIRKLGAIMCDEHSFTYYKDNPDLSLTTIESVPSNQPVYVRMPWADVALCAGTTPYKALVSKSLVDRFEYCAGACPDLSRFRKGEAYSQVLLFSAAEKPGPTTETTLGKRAEPTAPPSSSKGPPKVAKRAQIEQPRRSKPHGSTAGTAVFVDKTGYLVTNAHVVDECRSINVALGERRMKADVVSLDRMNDLALLKADQNVAGVAKFRLGIVKAGENVVVIGFPYRGLLAEEASVTNGIISTLAGIANDSRFFQISAPVQVGNSGGPLLDEFGTVVGIVESKLDVLLVAQVTGDLPQNVNFAIKASTIQTFLDYKGVTYEAKPPGPRLSTAQLAEDAKRYTAAIECVK